MRDTRPCLIHPCTEDCDVRKKTKKALNGFQRTILLVSDRD
jgi:hypothetical protein